MSGGPEVYFGISGREVYVTAPTLEGSTGQLMFLERSARAIDEACRLAYAHALLNGVEVKFGGPVSSKAYQEWAEKNGVSDESQKPPEAKAD